MKIDQKNKWINLSTIGIITSSTYVFATCYMASENLQPCRDAAMNTPPATVVESSVPETCTLRDESYDEWVDDQPIATTGSGSYKTPITQCKIFYDCPTTPDAYWWGVISTTNSFFKLTLGCPQGGS